MEERLFGSFLFSAASSQSSPAVGVPARHAQHCRRLPAGSSAGEKPPWGWARAARAYNLCVGCVEVCTRYASECGERGCVVGTRPTGTGAQAAAGWRRLEAEGVGHDRCHSNKDKQGRGPWCLPWSGAGPRGRAAASNCKQGRTSL